jgi:rRNA-processing protein FCF1
MPIIIDTNFIMTCVKQKVQLFDQLGKLYPGEKLFIPSNVIDELKMLSSRKELKMSEREAADLALQLTEHEKIVILDLDGKVDNAIIKYAIENNKVVVASLDKVMKKKIKKNAKFLTIRKEKLVREA